MSASTSSPERFDRSGRTTERRLELWLRPGALDGANHLLDRARSLERDGVVETVDVSLWDAYHDLSSPLSSHREREARARVQAFKRWAWRNGRALAGFSERHRAGRGRMGVEFVAQRVPRVVLAEYENDFLVYVTPCQSHDQSVTERLETLEQADVDTERQYSQVVR